MEYKKINKNSYNLHIIKTDKFKSVTVSVNFREQIKKEEITLRKFLFQMLCSSTKLYNTERLLEIKLEDLYSTSLSYSSIVFGNIINSYIDIRFLNKEYSDELNLSNSLDLLFETIFNPNVVNNAFEIKKFNKTKDKINLILNSEKENIQKYTINKSLEIMDALDPAAFNLWGYKEDLEKITPENLYEYYKKVLNTNIVDIFVVGNVSIDEIESIFDEKFKINNTKKENVEAFITYEDCNETIIKEEEMNLKQSKLSIILKALNLSIFERRYVLPLYASILGGSGNSRLFQNIREKRSLCYTINAFSKMPNSLILIYSGIDNKNYEEVVNLIKNEIKLKNINEEELENVKKEYIGSVKTLLDNPSNIINYYFGIEVFNSDEIEEKIKKYNKVTIEDIKNIAKKIKIATIYLLRGTSDEE